MTKRKLLRLFSTQLDHEKLDIAFESKVGHVFSNEILQGSFDHPYKDEDVEALACHNMGGLFMLAHKDYPPYELFPDKEFKPVFRKIDFGDGE